jgi:hypothetical protein
MKKSFLNVNKRRWTEEEIAFLKKNYSEMAKEEMLKALPIRSWNSIVLKAGFLGLHRSTRKKKLEKLLGESLEVYYWLGFLAADGHFSKVGRLKLTLSKKDEDHLRKFHEFIAVGVLHEETENRISVSVMDVNTVEILRNRFAFTNRKTYEPCSLESIKGVKLKAFTIGFIDGDGALGYQSGRTDCQLRVKCHASWKANLTKMFGWCKINNKGYAQTGIYDNEKLRELKRFSLSEKLPIMERKWSKIDLNRVSKYKKTAENVKAIEKLVKEGKRQKDIAKILNLSAATISNLIKRKSISYKRGKNNV